MCIPLTNTVIHFVGRGEEASAMIELSRMDDVQAKARTFIDGHEDEMLSFSFFANSAGLYVSGLLSLLASFRQYSPLPFDGF